MPAVPGAGDHVALVTALLSRLVGVIYDTSPSFKRSFWRVCYEYVADKYPEADLAFMNYGYISLDPRERVIDLLSSDERDRSAIQLYAHAVGTVALRGLDVLEVGCGHGGGCSYIRRYLGPRSVVGVDFSRRAIALCNRHHAAQGLTFAQGDAESLPFADSAFDVVINVESSHCYGSMERFLLEVLRVLRPRGHFLFADFRGARDLATLREQLRSSGLAWLQEEVITPNVLGALDQDDQRKEALIQQRTSVPLRTLFRQWAATKGTRTYEALRDGRTEYLSWVFRKGDL